MSGHSEYLYHFADHADRVPGCVYCRGEFTSRRQFLAPATNEKITELFDLLGVPENMRDSLQVGDLLDRIIAIQRQVDNDRAVRRL